MVTTNLRPGYLRRNGVPYSANARLTEFYLLLSVGGVLGGVFNALLAPVLFPIPLEYPIAIALACFVAPNRQAKRRGPVPRLALDVALPWT